MLIEYLPTFDYFNHFVTWNPNDKILDFGSNCGNLLKSNPGIIKENNYTGIDIDHGSILTGQELFPSAKWVSYNRRNPAYNFNGENILPPLDDTYDLIVSYSVFSHTTFEDMIELLDYLYGRLNPKGKIYFTFCNVGKSYCVEWFRNRRVNCDLVPKKNLVYLVDNKVSYTEPTEPCIHFVAFYQAEWLLEKLKKFNPKINPAPIYWIQDCIEIVKN
jgi:SAM-dependent methyltransferase